MCCHHHLPRSPVCDAPRFSSLVTPLVQLVAQLSPPVIFPRHLRHVRGHRRCRRFRYLHGYPCNSGFNGLHRFAGAGTPPPPPCLTDLDGNGARPISKISCNCYPTSALAPSDPIRRLGDESQITSIPCRKARDFSWAIQICECFLQSLEQFR